MKKKRGLDISFQGETTFKKVLIIYALSSIIPILVFFNLIFNIMKYEMKYEITTNSYIALHFYAAIFISLISLYFIRRTFKPFNILLNKLREMDAGRKEESVESGANLIESMNISELPDVAEAFRLVLNQIQRSAVNMEKQISHFFHLTQLIEMVSKIVDIEELLKLVLRKTSEAVSSQISSIMIVNEDKKTLRIVSAEGPEGVNKDIIGKEININESISGKVVLTGKEILVADIESDNRFSKRNDPKYGNGSFVCLPLKARNKVVGVINLAKKADGTTFSENDLQFLMALLNHIAFAVENAKLLDETKHYATNLEDIVKKKTTELEKAQQKIIQGEKLSALGELVAGVAHELNNPLTAIVGYTRLLLDSDSSLEIKEDLDRIFKESSRCIKIVNNLLTFAKMHKQEKREIVSINQLLEETISLRLSQLKAENIKIIKEFDSALPNTLADSIQLQQVFLNIINNARDALKDYRGDGKITVKTERIDGQIKIQFIDDGPGITSEDLNRIFDPFFTSKKAKGTGLGLSISYGIITKHEGRIYVNSAPGEGADFIIELPVKTEEAKAGEVVSELKKIDYRGRKIMAVDNEKIILSLLERMLKKIGFKVDTFDNAKLALQKIEQEEYDVILTDFRMPQMSGVEFYQSIIKVNPNLSRKIIFLSGDVISKDIQSFLSKTKSFYLRKPFEVEELEDVLHKVIEE
ncbi:MAG: response regulator [Armatimonadetes bacterium]|nr:response regulator [Armatimonadota bacterium]